MTTRRTKRGRRREEKSERNREISPNGNSWRHKVDTSSQISGCV